MLLWSSGIVEPECTTCPTQSLPWGWWQTGSVLLSLCSSGFSWCFQLESELQQPAELCWFVPEQCPAVLPTGLFPPLSLAGCWRLCWDTGLVLESSSSANRGCCCFRSSSLCLFYCKFSVPQRDKGWSGCSAELHQNIPICNRVSKSREIITNRTGHCLCDSQHSLHWVLSKDETPSSKGLRGKCFPRNVWNAGLPSECKPHKPNKSRSQHAAEQGLLDAEWELFGFLGDWSSCC